MRHLHRFIFVFLSLVVVFPVHVAPLQAAQTENCSTLIARQDNNYLVSFIQPATGEFIRTDQLPYHFAFSYSPDCRFLIGQSTGYNNCKPGLIIWDASTGERRQTFDGSFCDTAWTTFANLIWKPDYTAVIISGWNNRWNTNINTGDFYLWSPDSNHLIRLLTSDWSKVSPNLAQVFWDDVRGWLWSSGNNGVAAFNISTGELIGNYINIDEETARYFGTLSYFTFSPDLLKVIVHGQGDFQGYTRPALTVYDIASGVGIAVNPELNAAGEVALSPDNRYLIMNYTAIRVWDLHNLPEKLEDRLPVYRLSRHGRDSDIYFVNEHILAVENGDTIIQWDLHTGQQVEPAP